MIGTIVDFYIKEYSGGTTFINVLKRGLIKDKFNHLQFMKGNGTYENMDYYIIESEDVYHKIPCSEILFAKN